jgi:hypothetical protein
MDFQATIAVLKRYGPFILPFANERVNQSGWLGRISPQSPKNLVANPCPLD